MMNFKRSVLFLLMILFASPAFATSGKVESVFNATSLNGTGTTVTSRVFNVGSIYKMGYWLKPGKAATPEGAQLRITMEGAYADTPSSIFATMATIIQSYGFSTTVTPIATAGTIDTPSMKYVRFVAEGNAGNSTGTTVTLWLYTQEQN